MVFMVPGWFFMVPGWFFSKMYPPKLYPGPTIQSRSAARRAAQDLVVIKKLMEISMTEMLKRNLIKNSRCQSSSAAGTASM